MTSSILGHLIHYALYLYDAHRSEPLDSLDDIVYYLKASIHSLELVNLESHKDV